MEDCIFCKIAKGEIKSVKIWEDEEYIAILDMFPNTEGMTLVIPKKHFDSDVFEMPEEDYNKLMLASRKVAKVLEEGLDVKRVSMVMEGMGINHIHVKLYPLHGLKEKFTEMWHPKEVYFDKYEGYLTTQIGPKKEIEDLKKVAEKIRGKIN
jgi:diadenosine tetraphosphate (Ap4A) HIT family hydrolase